MSSLIGEKAADPETEVALCFDDTLTPYLVREFITTMGNSISSIGAKVDRVDFGPTLRIKGQWISNLKRNKMVLTMKKRTADEDVFPGHVIKGFQEFFSNKVN